MQAGKLRKRIEIQSAIETRDAHGGVSRTWSTDVTRWASVEPLRMRETFEGQQIDARLTHFIRLRYISGLTDRHRLKFGSRIFHIHSVKNIEERDRETQVLAMEQP